MYNSKALKVIISVGAAGSAALIFGSNDLHVGKLKSFLFSKNLAYAATAEDNYKTHVSFSSWNNNWDRRDPFHLVNPSKLDKMTNGSNETKEALKDLLLGHTPTTTRNLIFIRHGQYQNKFKEDEKRILTPLGQEQAIYTGIRLRELGLDYDRVIESSMTRAIETSDLIQAQLKNVKVERTDLLREGSPIQPDPPFNQWRPEISTFRDGPRIEAAFRKYVHRAEVSQKQDSFEIVVCHANVIRYIVCRALQLPPQAWLRMSLRHGSITWISIRPNGHVTLKCFGESSHMPVDKLTSE